MKISILLSLAMILFVRCTSDKEDYFARPSWLEPPIYEVLQNQGKFTNYLKCVDRTYYASSLKASGLYTVFAPNDEAFQSYLQEKNVSSVNDLPDSLVNKIVSYSIVYNNYPFDRLTDVLNGGWDTLASIRKKTAYYESIYPMKYQDNDIWVYDLPGNSATIGTVVEQNFKYVPLYLSRVFERNRSAAQAASDYSMFYSTPYTGKNVQRASVVTKDMKAENGVAHEIDQVLEPLPNLEKLLNDPDYSEFKAIINRTGETGEPYYISYTYNDLLTSYFKKSMPDKNIKSVYYKYYTGLPITLCGERYGVNQAQAEQGGFTMFAPNNAAVNKFYEEKLKEYYPNGLNTVNKDILGYFINAQMIDELVWPNDFKGSMNSLGEFLNGKGAKGEDFNKTKYSKIAPASNGFFYGSNDYIKSRYFETVYTEILLNPTYNLFNTALVEYYNATLKEELLQCELNGYTQENYTILLPSDELLAADGFSWAWISGSNKYGFLNSNSGSSLGNFDVAARIQRLVKSHIFKRIENDEVKSAIKEFTTKPDFATAYGGYSYAVNEYGDMIRYKDGKIQMLGNYDENDWVTATAYKTFTNGQIFKIDKMLQYSRRNSYPRAPEGYKSQDLVTYILSMAAATQNPYVAKFKNYLVACLKGDESNELAGISADMTLTIFMPTNTQIDKAVANGDLPALDLVKTDASAREQATKFVLYHMVKGKVFVDDGLDHILPNNEKITEETWPTVLKDVVNNTYLAVRKTTDGKLVVSSHVEGTNKDLSATPKTSTVIRGVKHSNYFAAKAVLHEIDNYLVYKKIQ